MKNLEALFCTISLRAGVQSVSKAASILFIVYSTRDVLMGIITVGPRPPCVYPLST